MGRSTRHHLLMARSNRLADHRLHAACPALAPDEMPCATMTDLAVVGMREADLRP